MNELGVADFKSKVKIGDEISVATVLKDYDNENIHYRGEVLEFKDTWFILKEDGIKHIIDYKDVYWHSAE